MKLKLFLLFFVSIIYNLSFANQSINNKVNATLSSSCQISANNINFGNIAASNSGSTNLVSSLQILCSKQSSYQIKLSLGLNGDRTLKGQNHGQFIYYSLCQAPGWSNVNYSNCTNGYWTPSYPQNGTGTGTTQTIPVYAYVPNGFYTPDTYTDTTTAFIYF